MDSAITISEMILIVGLIGIFVSCVFNILFNIYRIIAKKYIHTPFTNYFLGYANTIQIFLLLATVLFLMLMLIGGVLRLLFSLFIH